MDLPQNHETFIRSGTFAPSSFNSEAGTVDVVLSTGAGVQRNGFVERLTVSPEAVTVAPRLPVLDSHRKASIGDILGRAESVRFEGGQMIATLRISNAAALDAIERGDLTGVSIGYAAAKWANGTDPQTGERTRTATAWTLKEVSLVPLPADPEALIRSEQLPTTEIQTPPDPTAIQTRAAIRAVAATAGLDAAWADSQIDSGADLTATRAAAFEEMTRRTPALRTATVDISAEDPAVIATRQADALHARISGGAPSEAARPYMAWGLVEYARDALTRTGVVGVTMMGHEELLQRALATTSDFPNLLTASGNRVLANAYQAAQSPLKQLARQRTAADFRPMSVLKLGEFGSLKKVTEAGEITALSTAEAKEGYSLDTFAGMFALSRKALINDDLGAFARWGEMMGRAAAETETGRFLALLNLNSGAGPTMGDGKALFHADHGNLAASGAVISSGTLSAARLAMRLQKGLDGVTPVNAQPKYLLVDPSQETTAEAYLAELTPTTVADQNPFAGALTLLVEPRLTVGDWYVFADPAVLPVLEYAYLSSAQGPQLASRDGWEVLGREFRVVLDFGCGATEHRGAYRNPGA